VAVELVVQTMVLPVELEQLILAVAVVAVVLLEHLEEMVDQVLLF
jgi:hypothetical protein